MFSKFFNFKLYLSILLCSVCILGDFLTNSARSGSMTKALLDNTTHGIVGLLSILFLTNHFRERLEVWEGPAMLLVAYLVASGIDADHFITARSLKLLDAINLPKRPFLHCSTIPLLVLIILLLTARYFKSLTTCLWLSVIFLAFASHHIRDSIRRGLWFCPFGSTNPTPYALYFLLTVFLPHITIILLSRITHPKNPATIPQPEEITV